STRGTSVNVYIVNVSSSGNFKYNPNTIFANIGNVIIFKFYSLNYPVICKEYIGSSIYGDIGYNLCVLYKLIHLGIIGAYIIIDLTFSIIINNTSPIWFYCIALLSYYSNGMVSVINPINRISVNI
ncbi:hypothetical protein V2W45_1242155, partial [Cenococcum geophilum]